MPLKTQLIAGLLLSSIVLTAPADSIIVGDGDNVTISNNETYETITVLEGGMLTIEQNAKISTSLEIFGGTVLAQGGTINNTQLTSGWLNVNADSITLNNGFNATGGTVVFNDPEAGGNGVTVSSDHSFIFAGTVDATMYNLRNSNGSMLVTNNAVVRFLSPGGNDYQLQSSAGNAMIDETTGLVTDSSGELSYPINGQFYGNGCNVVFDIGSDNGQLYLNIPEPATVSFIVLGGASLIGIRRFFS